MKNTKHSPIIYYSIKEVKKKHIFLEHEKTYDFYIYFETLLSVPTFSSIQILTYGLLRYFIQK